MHVRQKSALLVIVLSMLATGIGTTGTSATAALTPPVPLPRCSAPSVPDQKFGDRFSGARRPDGKARRPRISGILEGGATQPAGMARPENVSEFLIRDTGAQPRPGAQSGVKAAIRPIGQVRHFEKANLAVSAGVASDGSIQIEA